MMSIEYEAKILHINTAQFVQQVAVKFWCDKSKQTKNRRSKNQLYTLSYLDKMSPTVL